MKMIDFSLIPCSTNKSENDRRHESIQAERGYESLAEAKKEEGRNKDLPGILRQTTVLLLWQKIIEKVNFECVNKRRNKKGTDRERK